MGLLRSISPVRSRIAIRLALLIIAVSSVMTLFITMAQLLSDYHQQRDDLDRQLDQVQVLLPSLAASVWTFNDRQILLGLRAVVNLPNIERASIATLAGDNSWSEGESRSTSVVTRNYSLVYGGRGPDQRLGSMEVTASLDSIYRRLLSRAVTLLLSNGVKTFLVALLILALFRRLVTSRLEALEARISNLLPGLSLFLPREASVPPSEPKGGDEIDRLERGFDHMTGQLRQAVTELQDSAASLRDANGELDIRVRRRTAELEAANHSLVEAKKVAEDAAETERQIRREQRNFLSMVSHEFRLPLSIIAASSQLLGLFTRHDAVAQEELAKITRAVGRMSGLMTICLADERLEAGIMTLGLAPVDLSVLAEELCGEARQVFAGRDIVLRTGGKVVLEADASLLRIVISNLLDNAVKFSTPDRAVELVVIEDGDAVILSVVDRGIGIASDDRDRIFEKYYRSNAADGVHGAGLGLHIVSQIVDLHAGTIEIDSQPGQGTTVSVRLPRSYAQSR
ncbi:MAG: two-component sensor histidine kinase [Magnetospirillum sp.]|nr:two-component sensor histidine kinase [Magnetospirillum sp.]